MAILIILIVLGAYLRFWMAASLPLWWDESFTWAGAQRSLATILTWEHHPKHAPLAYAVTKTFDRFVSHKEVVLRAPFILFALINVVLAYMLGARVVNRFVGIIFAAFLALTPSLVSTDSEIRMYSMWLMACFLIVWSFRQLHKDGENPFVATYGAWITLALSLAFAYWIHRLTVFVWIPVVIAVLRDYRQYDHPQNGRRYLAEKKLLLLVGVTTLLSLPGLLVIPGEVWIFLKQLPIMFRDFISPRAGPIKVVSLEEAWIFLQQLPATFRDFMSTRAWPIVAALAFWGLWKLPQKEKATRLLLVAMFLTSALSLLLIGRFQDPAARYLYPAAIPLYLGVANAVWWLLSKLRLETNYTVIFATLIVIVGYKATQAIRWTSSTISYPPGRYFAALLVSQVSNKRASHEKVMVSPPWLKSLAEYYGIAGEDILYGPRGLKRIDAMTESGQPFWVIVTSHASTQEPAVFEPLLSAYSKLVCMDQGALSRQTEHVFALRQTPQIVGVHTIDESGNPKSVQCDKWQ